MKQQADRGRQQAELEKEELQAIVEMITKREQEQKKQLEYIKTEMKRQKQNILTMQDVCMQKI